ncbi:DUF4105 domain-containing protein [Marinobacteraceae bacterium S3BR75-40.1]
MAKRLGLRLLTGCVLCLLQTALWAKSTVSNPDLETLAHRTHWLDLVHYQPTWNDGYESQADDGDFFLAPNGKTDPVAELAATIEALQQPRNGDSHAACRFPARAEWIRQQMDVDIPEGHCPELEDWMADLDTETVTLVFAASYLNSPSSMFGHTFIRLDPPQDNEEADLLLAKTISYAADAGASDNELLFAYRGIFGGYPGITSVEPYYEKIKLYSDLENRDLWEYQLNLTPTEIRRLLWHAWELRDIRFDYYFLDENCAYRLLALIDVARPGTNLLEDVTTHAIPSDTIRWVVDKDLVADVHYRPSAATTVDYALESLSPEERALVAAIVYDQMNLQDPAMTRRSPESQARILDTAHDFVRYAAVEKEWPRERSAPLSYQTLLARSRLDSDHVPPQPAKPEVRDDEGHDTFRISLLGGRDNDRNYTQLTLRPAYHDVLDPVAGYRPGAQLQFLRLDTRYYLDNEELQLERFVPVEIRSLSPRDPFFTPLSWQVGFGARRREVADREQRILTPYVDGGAGLTYDVAGWFLSGFTTAALEIDSTLEKGWDAAPGLQLSALRQGERLALEGGVSQDWWLVGDTYRQGKLYLELRLPLQRGWSIGTQWARQHTDDRYSTQWSLGLHAYF